MFKLFIYSIIVISSCFFTAFILNYSNKSSIYTPVEISDAGEIARECSECRQKIQQCMLTPALKTRYKTLNNEYTYMFAIALHNSKPLINNMLSQLMQVFDELGKENVFVSIYESGSTDKTPIFVQALAVELELNNITTKIVMNPKSINWNQVHRIKALADVRNVVLQPLFEDIQASKKSNSPAKFHKIIFLNDVVFCAADILEMILQHKNSGSYMTCPLDFGAWDYHFSPFYDIWVARTMAGDILYDAFSDYQDIRLYEEKHNVTLNITERRRVRDVNWDSQVPKEGTNLFWKDNVAKERAKRGYNVQVYSCWNGGAVIDARPFYEEQIIFRNGYPGECSESECSHFCKDLWNSGYGKISIVPTVSLAYTLKDFMKVRTAWEDIKLPFERVVPLYARNLHSNDNSCVSNECTDEEIIWRDIPSKVMCFSLDKIGEHNVDWTNTTWIDPKIRDKYS